ncbi:MAG: apolipoprotein N-acyltransferase [Spirochaetales bacterium]|jgi:apolipoprotein N-acyltransferase|nr:apolipoprotein N-acyltransferase [Spirochaetales bacterium]
MNEKPKRSLMSFLYEMLLLAAGAYLYALAFPSIWSDSGWPWFAAVALIPVVYVIDRSPWSLAWFYGLAFGVGFYSLFNYWLSTFHQLAIYICGIIKGLELTVVFLLLKASYNRGGRFGYLVQSFLYTSYTFISQKGFFAYSYGQLGSAFYSMTPAIQLADITGIWGISFLLFLPQAFVANLLHQNEQPEPMHYRKQWMDALVITLLWILNFAYGFAAINRYKNLQPSRTIDIAAIQHNSDSWKGGFSQYKKNLDILSSLTRQSMEAEPDMVIWSETAFVPSVEWHVNYPSNYSTSLLVDSFVEFGKNLRVPLVTGNPEGILKDPDLPPFDEKGNWNRIDYNSVILFGDGQILGTYRKQHLVPFTEYFPYEDLFPKFTEFLKSHDFHWWLQGNESKVFEYDGINFSTSICFEDTFSDISRKFVKAGSDLLLNLSNDSWSGAVPAEMQHMAIGVFRSVENKKTTIRSTNSGITCMITPWGEIVDPIEPFTANWQLYQAPIYEENTLYTMWGDWFAYLCMILLAVGLAMPIIRKVTRKTKGS